MNNTSENKLGEFVTINKNGRPKKAKNGVKINNQTGKAECGRPTIITKNIVQKLEEAFSMDCTDLEACLHAGISKSTLYNYQLLNLEFMERKQILKMSTILKARRTVVNALEGDPKFALAYLERKKKDEFSLRTELTGKEGGEVELQTQINIISK